jgi:hypothetical protein
MDRVWIVLGVFDLVAGVNLLLMASGHIGHRWKRVLNSELINGVWTHR